MDISDVAHHNRQLILKVILRSSGISRSEISRKTGLAKSTVTSITDRLVSRNFLSTLNFVKDGKKGRPLELLSLNTEKSLVAVAIYSPNASKAFLLKPTGEVLDSRRLPLKKNSSAHNYIDGQIRMIKALGNSRWDAIRAISLVEPGFIDTEQGVIKLCTHKGWRDVQMVKPFLQFGKPVFLQNGSRIRAEAENWNGAAQDVDDFLYFHLGYGIGGAIVLDGEVLEGPRHGAGEFGHVIVEPGGSRCICGGNGCLETIASIRSILNKCEDSGLTSFADVWEARRRGIGSVTKVMDEAIKAIARVVVNKAVAIGPDTVVAGGAMVEESDGEILDFLRSEVNATNSFIAEDIEIRRATLPDEKAEQIGAVVHALEEIDLGRNHAG